MGYENPGNAKQTLIYATVVNDSKAAGSKSGYDVGIKYSW